MPKWRVTSKAIFKNVPQSLFIFTAVVMTTFRVTPTAFGKDVTVFDVRRPVAMDDEDRPPKDYFINAGASDGLKSGMLVNVQRRLSLTDPYQTKTPEDLVVKVGQLRIIHVQGDVCVARMEKVDKREYLPTLEYEAIMVGDKVDLSSAKMAPQKTASLDSISMESSPAITAAALVAVPVPAAAPTTTESVIPTTTLKTNDVSSSEASSSGSSGSSQAQPSSPTTM